MNVNFLLYDDFDMMDLAAPGKIFDSAGGEFHLNYLSLNGDIINSMQGVKLWTEPLDMKELDGILVLPGGRGARRLIHHDEQYIKILKQSVNKCDACLMIGNASGIMAQTGVLYHRNVAAYSNDENWRRMFTAAISWVDDATWVADGKFYSCKSSLTAYDVTLGLIADIVDVDASMKIAEKLGYEWELDDQGYY